MGWYQVLKVIAWAAGAESMEILFGSSTRVPVRGFLNSADYKDDLACWDTTKYFKVNIDPDDTVRRVCEKFFEQHCLNPEIPEVLFPGMFTISTRIGNPLQENKKIKLWFDDMGRAARERAQEQGLLPDDSKLDLAVFAKRVVSRVPFPYTLVIKTEAETITVPVWFSTKIKFIQHYLFKKAGFAADQQRFVYEGKLLKLRGENEEDDSLGTMLQKHFENDTPTDTNAKIFNLSLSPSPTNKKSGLSLSPTNKKAMQSERDQVKKSIQYSFGKSNNLQDIPADGRAGTVRLELVLRDISSFRTAIGARTVVVTASPSRRRNSRLTMYLQGMEKTFSTLVQGSNHRHVLKVIEKFL